MQDIIHIGYNKTASTWLQMDVFPKLRNRTYLVANDECRRLMYEDEDRSAIEGVSRIARSTASGTVLSYEALSGRVYFGSPHRFRTADRLKMALREPGAIIVVRAQPTMLVSLYSQYVNQGGTHAFTNFLTSDAPGLSFDADHLMYDKLVGHYIHVFGRDNVAVLIFEDLRLNRERFLSTLSGFLGEQVHGSETERNPSASAWAIRALRAWNRTFRESPFNSEPTLPLRRAARGRTLAQRMTFGASLFERCRDEATEFAQRYSDSNLRLEGHVGIDLRALGYPMPGDR
jgi:hypothetical protein